MRATYLYSAMADVGTLTGNSRPTQTALGRIWGNITSTLECTSQADWGPCMGSKDLARPTFCQHADAFNETCAAVGNVLFNYRMFLLHKDAKYLDVAEVALLNNVLAAVNLEGNRFFYVNPLESDGKYPFNHGTAGRAPWFGTACCPSNIARLLPQVAGMTYAQNGDDLYVTFYAESNTSVDIDGVEVKVRQKTAYPNDGEVSVVLSPRKPARFRLLLRIPTWARERFVPGGLYRYADSTVEAFQLTVNGTAVETTVERGFAAIDREWKQGDRVNLRLPMPVRITECHPSVEANRNRIALTRGPLVLCAEGVDNGGATQRFFFGELPDTSSATLSEKIIGAGSFIQVSLPAQALTADDGVEDIDLVLTPYYAWNNRGVNSMNVWFPQKQALAEFDPTSLPQESPFAQVTASHTFAEDTVSAVGDNREPRYSNGSKDSRWSSRPQKGKDQWIEARFSEAKTLRSIGLYWYNNQKDVKLPAEWSLEVEKDGKWSRMELYVTDEYGLRVNQYNVVHPAAELTCDAIRVLMTPQEESCVGVLEIKVVFEEKTGKNRVAESSLRSSR